MMLKIKGTFYNENHNLLRYSVKFIKLTFKSRFLLAKTCNKIPLISNIVDKLLFEGDDIQVLPRDGTIKNLTIKDITINKDIPSLQMLCFQVKF
jgi:hypothetical protein